MVKFTLPNIFLKLVGLRVFKEINYPYEHVTSLCWKAFYFMILVYDDDIKHFPL